MPDTPKPEMLTSDESLEALRTLIGKPIHEAVANFTWTFPGRVLVHSKAPGRRVILALRLLDYRFVEIAWASVARPVHFDSFSVRVTQTPEGIALEQPDGVRPESTISFHPPGLHRPLQAVSVYQIESGPVIYDEVLVLEWEDRRVALGYFGTVNDRFLEVVLDEAAIDRALQHLRLRVRLDRHEGAPSHEGERENGVLGRSPSTGHPASVPAPDAEAYERWEPEEGIRWPSAATEICEERGVLLVRLRFSWMTNGPSRDLRLRFGHVEAFRSYEEFAYPWRGGPDDTEPFRAGRLPRLGYEPWERYAFPCVRVRNSRWLRTLPPERLDAWAGRLHHYLFVSLDRTVDVAAVGEVEAEWLPKA